MSFSESEPKFMISVISSMLDIHPQTLRTYERLGLVQPCRSRGNTRLYSENDVTVIKKILTLTRDMGVNLAGVEVILRLTRQMEFLQSEVQDLIDFVREELTKEHSDLGHCFDRILVRSPGSNLIKVTTDDRTTSSGTTS